MMNLIADLRKKAAGVATILVLLGVVILIYGWWIGKFSKREILLGIAGSLVASGVVIITIGPAEQDELAELFSRSSSRSRVADVLREVLDQLERNEIFIRSHRTEVEFGTDLNSQMLCGEVFSEYTIENIAGHRINYALRFGLGAMKEILEAQPIEWLQFEVMKRRKNGVRWEPVSVKYPGRGESRVSHDIPMEYEENIRVRWRHRRAFWKTGNLAVLPMNPCDGLEVEFSFPKGMKAEIFALDPRLGKSKITSENEKFRLAMEGVVQGGWGAQLEWRPTT